MQQGTETISVVLADDHAIVREGIAALCTTHASIRVIGLCSDGQAALEMIRSLRPDFAILDMNMPGLTGVEVVRKLRLSGCPTRLMILSIARDDETVIQALNAGADAYLLKDGPVRHLFDAINYVRDGGIYLSPLLKSTRLLGRTSPSETSDPLVKLSKREREVFTYLVMGVRPKKIAEILAISPKTVDSHRASLMRKLNVHDVVGLVKFAVERNLVSSLGTE